jgi:photosystem II stability/assembly factor-like uncharacterized protein
VAISLRRALALGISTFVLLTAAAGKSKPAEKALPAVPEGLFDSLDFRPLGPVGNRVPAVVGVPGDPNTYYFGAASGGVFKSTDGGHRWAPIFDGQKVASIGALALAPSDTNVLWVGTGEAFLRSNVSIGNGVYRSTDAGKTFAHLGLEKTGRISRIVVHPRDPDVAWVAALGHCYGPQEDRGVYKTTDGGKNWRRVLFVDENTGASDLVIDPNNPRILFAGMWQIEMKTWGRWSGGPGSGLYSSRDGGETWKKLEKNGLPDPPWGKVALTMSARDSSRLYALIETSTNRDFAEVEDFAGVLWRSDDGGDSFKMVNADNRLVQRPLYYSRALAAPDDADEVHFMSVVQTRSLDGGISFTENSSGWDHHDIWIDPLLPNRIATGHDGGVSISTNRGKTWYRPLLPIAQMYHVAVDDRIPYNVYGNRQDGNALRGPSNTLTYAEIPVGAWQAVGGCEVGFTLPDPRDSNFVWAGCYDGILTRYDERSGSARDVSVWPEAIESWPAEDLKYRFQWTFPLLISPHDGGRVYAGSQYLHRSTDDGQSWQVISPDLTSDDPELQRRTGGLTLDDAGPTLAPTLFALAESPLAAGEIWTGSNDGLVNLTRDGGATWTNLTANLKGLPERGTISNIEPSRHAAGKTYLTVDRHQLGDFAPYVYKTADFGANWQKIAGGLPSGPLGFAHCVREDSRVPGLLYLGIENGLYLSFDDGESWHAMQGNLPPAPLHWLTIQEKFDDLVLATYGRGIYVLDDLGTVRQLASRLAKGDRAWRGEKLLLAPENAWRFRPREIPMSQPDDPVAGRNPEYGAAIAYYLPEDFAGTLELAVYAGDEKKPFRKLDKPPAKKGLNRVHWDLLGEQSAEIKLRTKPLENSKLPLPDSGWRPLADGFRLRLLAPPGRYRVELAAKPEKKEGATEEPARQVLEQSFELLSDPRTAATPAELGEQQRLLESLWQLQQRSATLVNQAEWQRKALADLETRLKDRPEGEKENPHQALIDAGKKVDASLREVEGLFFDLRLTTAGQDSLRWKRLIYGRISQLGWQAGRADARPTDSQLAVFASLAEQVAAAEKRMETLRAEDLPALEKLLAASGVGPIVYPP